MATSLEQLLAGATERRPMVPADTKSGARFEWVSLGGERYLLKYQDNRDDWLMRATGDRGVRFVRLWEHGLLDVVPDVIDHAVVGAALDGTVGAILQRDVTTGLLPTDEAFPLERHQQFLDHMAALHARFWGWRDDIGLTPLTTRYLVFSPIVSQTEAAIGSGAIVPRVMGDGWARLAALSPAVASIVLGLLADPTPLVDALNILPHTFVHGDWKAGNLGAHPDGRTILLDWGEVPGEAVPTADLAWYLALNAALLPETKDETIVSYRRALERHGVDTEGWFDVAVDLELLGAMLQFGWEKGLGGPGPELAWWERRVMQGARRLGLG